MADPLDKSPLDPMGDDWRKQTEEPDPTLHNRKWDELMAEVYADLDQDMQAVEKRIKDREYYLAQSANNEAVEEKIFIADYGGWFYKGKFTPEKPE